MSDKYSIPPDFNDEKVWKHWLWTTITGNKESVETLATRLAAFEHRLVQCEDKVKDCEQSNDILLTRVDHSRNEILEKFERSVVPAIQLNEKLIETTTRLKEVQTQVAMAQVETKTQTIQTVTVTPSQIPPFWTIIKAWAANVNIIGPAFLTLVAIAVILIAWWEWSVRHTPK